MRRVATLVSTAAVMMFTVGLLAQAKPNFAGKWTLDAEKTAAANPNAGGGGGGRAGGGGGGRMGGGGGAMTVTQDATTLAITREGQNGPTTTTYKLDGTETTVPMGRGGEGKAKTKWDGNKLVIETSGQGQNGPTTQTVSWYMDGEHLVQERTTQNGAIKTYYKKG